MNQETWKCPKCGEEELEAQFDACWNCGTSRDGRPAALEQEFAAPSEAEPDPFKCWGWEERLLMTFGQTISVMTCIGSVTGALLVVLAAMAWGGNEGDPNAGAVSTLIYANTAWSLVGVAITFLYSAAMFVVFTRVKLLRPK